MAKQTREIDAITFGEKLLTLLEEGSFTSSYKYAVLLGMLDLCQEQASGDGSPPESITTRSLARKVLELYWHQAQPFVGLRGSRVLKQNAGGQAEVVTAIRQFRERHSNESVATFDRARISRPDEFNGLVVRTEVKLIEMPIPRLQRFGRTEDRFIYDLSWHPPISRKQIIMADPPMQIRFVNSSARHLVRLGALLRPLIIRRWTSQITKRNRSDVADALLEDFLFGVSRTALARVAPHLIDIQQGECFYCGQRLGVNCQIDHFIPWARYPDNGIENLVAADARCNGAKSLSLADPSHVENWIDHRFSSMASDGLSKLADRISWPRDPERTLGVARSIYLNLPETAMLWSGGRDFVEADIDALHALLSPEADSPTVQQS